MNPITRKKRWPLNIVWPTLAAIVALAAIFALPASPRAAMGAATTSPSTEPATAPRTTRDLLAHSDDNHFWIAQILQPNDAQPYEQTSLMVRGSFGEPWTQMPSVPERVLNLASSNGELVMVLEDGQWWIGDKDNYRPGPPPAGAAEVLTMANDQSDLWCVALGELQPATIPSTLPAAAPTTKPETQPSAIAKPAVHLILYRMDAGDWVDGIVLPTKAMEWARKISMTIVDKSPVIAWQQNEREILISRLHEGAWSPPQKMEMAPNSNFKLLTILNNAALWVSAAAAPGKAPSAGTLFTGYDFGHAVNLPLANSPGAPASGQILTPAFGNLHWLAASTGSNPPIDQEFTFEGQSAGAAKTVAGPPPETIPLGPCVLTAGAMILFAAIAAMRQRGSTSKTEPPVDVPNRLAPLGMRFAAGLVDLLPCLAALAVMHPTLPNGLPAKIDPASTGRTLLWLALLTYVLHTMVAELICRQSLGKILFDLRVVANDGKPASVTSIVLRNIFRGIDVTLIAVPLLYIFIAPLRQRIGDLIAGTVVIGEESDMDSEEGEESEE